MDGIKRLFSEFTVNCFWDTANNKKMSDGSFGGFSKEDWLFYQKIRKGALNYYAGSVNCYYNADNANRTGDGDFLQILCPTEALISVCSTIHFFQKSTLKNPVFIGFSSF